MKHERIDVQYHLHFDTAFHIGTGLPHGLIQRGIARDSAGFLFLPGSMIKGALRDHATQLAQLLGLKVRQPHDAQDISEFARRADITGLIFGSRFRPGTLFFDDARLSDEHRAFFKPEPNDNRFMTTQVETRTQVSLARVSGTARRQMLFNTEYGIPTLRFEGRIYGHLSGIPTIEGAPTYSLVLLLAALRSLERIGGNKSSGAGKATCTITQLCVDGVSVSPDSFLALLPDFEYYALAVEEERDR